MVACKTEVKKRKLNSDLEEVICVLGKMEKAAEDCTEERDIKRRQFEWELEERQRESERNMKRECN